MGRRVERARAAVEALQVASDEVLALAAIAREAAQQGRPEDARTLLQGLIVLEPERALLHTCLGCVHLLLGEDDPALDCFDQALARDPLDIPAHTYAGELRLARGEARAALAHLDAAIALDPVGRNAFANRARALRLGFVAATANPR